MAAPVSFDINGVTVTFPFQPYDIQKDYMSKVMACCQNGEHGLLESPTGTGKTLSLLCSSLAWLSEENRKVKCANKKAMANRKSPIKSPMKSAPMMADLGLPSKYRVIFTARTHKQVSQAMQEMKRTPYKDKLTAVCLGSREQYCVNPAVRSLPDNDSITQMCADKRKADPLPPANSLIKEANKTDEHRIPCKFYTPNFDFSNIIGELQNVTIHGSDGTADHSDEVVSYEDRGAVIDIEQLTDACVKENKCPYYAAQFAACTDDDDIGADVIFCPYNYLFNNFSKLSVKKAVVIFDEGHNIEKHCEDASSAAIKTFVLDRCHNGLTQLIKDIRNCNSRAIGAPGTDKLSQISDFAEKLSQAIQSYCRANMKRNPHYKMHEPRCCKPGIDWFINFVLPPPGPEDVIDLTKDEEEDEEEEEEGSAGDMIGSEWRTFKHLFAFFDLQRQKKDNDPTKYSLIYNGINHTLPFVKAMHSLRHFMNIAFDESCPDAFREVMQECYRPAITEDWEVISRDDHTRVEGFRLDLFCLNPGLALRKLIDVRGVRSIIITSGTLAPIVTFESECKIEFKHQLSNPHVIPRNQMMIFPVGSHSGVPLNGSKAATDDPNVRNRYHMHLGKAIADYVKVIPKGVLVFFKSYASMDMCMKNWRQNNILTDITSEKKIFMEVASKQFNPIFEAYKRYVDEGNGAIFAGVYRGKLSEGADLANDYCRGVILIGLPYAKLTDPYVELKRTFVAAKKGSQPQKLVFESDASSRESGDRTNRQE